MHACRSTLEDPTSSLRLALHLAIVAAALGLGLGVRAMLPARTAAGVALPDTSSPDKTAAAAPEVPPVFPNSSDRRLAGYSPAELDTLRSRVRDLPRSGNPIQEQFLLRDELLNSIATVEDFQRALDLLAASGAEVYFQQDLIRDLAARLAERDPVTAVGALTLIQDRHARNLAMTKVMHHWAEKDPEAALDYVRTQGTSVRASALNAIFGQLARRDPAAAMARTAEFQDPGFHYGLDRTVLSEWWEKDKDAALAWVNTQDPAKRKDLVRTLTEVAGREDPAAAWKLIQSMPIDERPDSFATNNLFYSWAHKDAQGALTAMLAETDTVRRGEIVEQLGRAMKLADEGSAAARGPAMLADIQDESLRQRFLYGLVQGYLHDGRDRDYQQVLTLTAQLTDEKQRLDAIKSLAGSWSKADAPSASEWLDTLPPGSERDGAIGEFVKGTFATDPAAALTWSASIADEGKRTRRLTELYPKWLKTDAAAAQSWLSQQTRLTPAERAALEGAVP